MKGLYRYLSPFTPDQSGAVSVLFELGGIIVICDAGGCAGNVCGFDEPRFFSWKSAVFSACLRDMDAIMGRDDRLVAKIGDAVSSYDAKFIAVIGPPVPSVMGTDYHAPRRMIEKKLSLPAFCINTNGMENYDAGEEKAYAELIRYAEEHEAADGSGRPEKPFAGVWAATPLDLAAPDSAQLLRSRLSSDGMRVVTYGMDSTFEDMLNCVYAARNYVVSPAGLKSAQHLKEKYGTPYELADSVRFDTPGGNARSGRKLVMHQQFLADTVRKELHRDNPSAEIDTATFFRFVPDYAQKGDVKLSEEDDFISLVKERRYDVIIADPLFRRALPDFTGTFIPLPHFAVSGQLNAVKSMQEFIRPLISSDI